MSHATMRIRGELGVIPIGATLTYDGFDHLDMEGAHYLHGHRVHPMTVSVPHGPYLPAIPALPKETRYRVVSHSRHMVELSYNPDDPTDVPSAPQQATTE